MTRPDELWLWQRFAARRRRRTPGADESQGSTTAGLYSSAAADNQSLTCCSAGHGRPYAYLPMRWSNELVVVSASDR